MQYSTFYAKLTPNGAVNGTRYSISVTGITWEGTDGLVTYSGVPLYFTIKPKSSGLATVTFKNETTGDVIGSKQILVRSTTLAKPTYSLAASATSINEGGTVTFTLDTSDVLRNTNVPYTITGVSVADISLNSLKGNFTIGVNGIATLPITLVNDELSEGTETLTLAIDQVAGLSRSVTINDTSLTPTYDLGWYSSVNGSTAKLTSVNEGHTVYLVLKTTNIANGTVFNYTISGAGVTSDDIGGVLSGNFIVNNNIGSATYTTKADRSTEGNELVTATVKRNDVVVGTPQFTLVDSSVSTTYNIGLYDGVSSNTEITSLSPITGGSFVINVGQGVDPQTKATTYGYSSGHNAGSLVSTALYMNGILITPDYADLRIVNLSSQGSLFLRMFPATAYPGGEYRIRMKNLNNGKSITSILMKDFFTITTGISIISMTEPSASVALNDVFIVNNRVEFSFEWL